MTGLDELDQATQDGMASLRQMQADGDIKLSFDVDSSIEGLSVDKLQSQIGESQTYHQQLQNHLIEHDQQVLRYLLRYSYF